MASQNPYQIQQGINAAIPQNSGLASSNVAANPL